MRRPSETRLRRAFSDVLSAVVSTTAGAMAVASAAGCGGGSTTTVDPAGGGGGGGGGTDAGVTFPVGFTSFCSADGSGTQRTFLQGLKTSPPIDGAVTRTEMAFTRTNTGAPGGGMNPPMDELGDAWTGTNDEHVGTLCATATNPSACLSKTSGFRILPASRDACVAQYGSYGYSQTACGTSYILYTRGDQIGVARTVEETKALIGTFDTVEEAMWVAQAKNLQVTCGGTGFAGGTTPTSGWRRTADGGWDLSLTEQSCGLESYQVVVHIDYAGNLTEVSRVDLHQMTGCAVAGRRPAGLRLDNTTRGGRDAVGEHFASMATLEAASVVSFRRLQRQLASFGAPRELLERIRKAARDEVRHARATGALAKKYGVTPAAPELGTCDESPSLFAIALENAREGCVRETYGALVAHLQMNRADDADVRACMAAIADEETEHAALSWDIAAWIESQLDDAQRAHLAAERRDAFATLARDLAAPVDPRVARVSGVPVAADALRMLEGLEPMLLAA
jgi:hypothetical protein